MIHYNNFTTIQLVKLLHQWALAIRKRSKENDPRMIRVTYALKGYDRVQHVLHARLGIN